MLGELVYKTHTRRTILKTCTYSNTVTETWGSCQRALDDGANADFGPTSDVTHCVAMDSIWDTLAVGCQNKTFLVVLYFRSKPVKDAISSYALLRVGFQLEDCLH